MLNRISFNGDAAALHSLTAYFDKLKEMIANQLKLDSNYRFTIDARNVLSGKVGALELPAEFLKKWLKKTNEKINDGNVNEEYEKMRPAAEWQLIKEKAVKNLGVKVEDADLQREAKMLASQQFAQYGMNNVPDEYIDKYAKDFLENKEYRQHLIEKAVDEQVKNATTQMEVEKEELEASLQQSLGIAAVGINRNVFTDVKNVLAEDLIDNLEQIGVEDARDIVESSFQRCGEEYLRTIVAKAEEFKGKSAEVRNEIAATVAGAAFQTKGLNLEHKAVASVRTPVMQENEGEVARLRNLFFGK